MSIAAVCDMSSTFLTLFVSRPRWLLPMPWLVLGRGMVRFGQRWSCLWRVVRPGSVSTKWLDECEVASAKRLDD